MLYFNTLLPTSRTCSFLIKMDLDDNPLANRRLSTVGDVRRALNPLQAQADRVGRQVEQFAETLDLNGE